MTHLVIYLIGFAVCWTVATVRDNLDPKLLQGHPPVVVFIGRVILCAIWPATLPQGLGIVIVQIVRKLGK